MKGTPFSMLPLAALLSTSAFAAPDFGQYVVKLKDGTDAKAFAKVAQKRTGGSTGYIYSNVFDGFAITMPKAALQGLKNHPLVELVEEDLAVSIVAQTVPTGVNRAFADYTAFDIDGQDDQRVDVDVAVLDTGIDFEHPDLNVVGGVDCTQLQGKGWRQTAFCDTSMNGDDDESHGTHVAGTIAALDNGIGVVGVAPGARLWAVKVLDSSGSGYTSGILAGIDWVIAQGNIEVLNMSLGGSGISTSYQTAIDRAVASGVTVVVAAGNSASDAGGFSPAFVPSAITVSALADFDGQAGGFAKSTCRADQDDSLASFSNFGRVVDIAAPGVCILSTYPMEMGAYATISGTSMAAPHVAGAAAVLASNGMGPLEIDAYLKSTGNYNWVDDSGDGIQEPLLDLTGYTPRFVGGEPPPPPPGPEEPEEPVNQAPVAAFTANCTELNCTLNASGSTDDKGVVSYTWLLGDGTTNTGVSLEHSYAAAGTYDITLTVEDAEGASSSTSQSVTVESGDTGTVQLVVRKFDYGRTWAVSIARSDGALLSGSFRPGGNCTNQSACTSEQRKNVSSVTFTASTGESVTVFK
jgi:subtilisin family serine protease